MTAKDVIRQIDVAIGSHGAWKLRIDRAIMSGKADTVAQGIERDDLCDFGKWLQQAGRDHAVRDSLPYKVVCLIHTDFHKCAGKVITLATEGKTSEARTLLSGDYTEQSDWLMDALIKWRSSMERQAMAA